MPGRYRFKHLPRTLDLAKMSNEQILRVAKHQKENPHAWWIPTGAQEEFIMALEQVGEGYSGHKCRYAAMFGGNATGKTSTMINIILGLVLPRTPNGDLYNSYLNKSRFFTDTERWAEGFAEDGNINILCLMKKKVIQKVFTPNMKLWAPKGSYTTEKGDAKFDHIWHFKNGGTLNMFTTEQEIGQLEGGQYDVIATDEHFPFHYMNELMQRTRGRGVWLSFQTPKYSIDSAMFVQKLVDMPEKERIMVYLHKESACKEHGKRGWRDHSVIRQEIKDCDPELYPAVVEGKPMAFAGKVFKQFNPEHNIIKEADAIEYIKKVGATIYASCDPAEARPYAIGWAAILPDNRVIWIDEWPEWNPSMEGEPELGVNELSFYTSPRLVPYDKIEGMRHSPGLFADVVRYKEAQIKVKYGLDVHIRFIDPIFSSRTGLGGANSSTLRAQLWDLGVRFEKAVKENELTSGHGNLRKLLETKVDDQGRIIQPPMMRYTDNCRNLIRHTANLSYMAETKKGEFTGRLADTVDSKDVFKDFVDVQRYLIQRNPYYVSPKEKKGDVEYDTFGNRKAPNYNYGLFSGF